MGGKSRKSGGISKTLIAQIKSGNKTLNKNKCKTKTPNDEPKKTLFDED